MLCVIVLYHTQVIVCFMMCFTQTWSQGHNPQGQGWCQGQRQYGSLFSQNFKTQMFIAGLVMTNFILIAKLTVT